MLAERGRLKAKRIVAVQVGQGVARCLSSKMAQNAKTPWRLHRRTAQKAEPIGSPQSLFDVKRNFFGTSHMLPAVTPPLSLHISNEERSVLPEVSESRAAQARFCAFPGSLKQPRSSEEAAELSSGVGMMLEKCSFCKKGVRWFLLVCFPLVLVEAVSKSRRP